MKKIMRVFAAVLVIAMVAGMAPLSVMQSFAAAERVLLGDVTGDTVLNTGDAVQVLRYNVDLISFNDKQLFVGDVNKNGFVNTGDAVQILRTIVGLLDEEWSTYDPAVTTEPTTLPTGEPTTPPTGEPTTPPTGEPTTPPTGEPTTPPTSEPTTQPTTPPTTPPASPGNYIEIDSLGDFLDIKNNLSGKYKLMCDLDIFDYTYNQLYQNRYLWTPIGSDTAPFTGIFDGNGYSITGAFMVNFGDTSVEVEDYEYKGDTALFGHNRGTICNLHVQGEAYGVTGGDAEGTAILCITNSGKIANCSTSGWVEACATSGPLCVANKHAGLVGTNRPTGTISQCWSNVNVDGTAFWWVGNLCGDNLGLIDNCFTFGYVAGAGAGGIAGDNANGTIRNCYTMSFIAGGGSSNYAMGHGFDMHSYGVFDGLFVMQGQYHTSPTSEPSTVHDNENGVSYTKLLTNEEFLKPETFKSVFDENIWVLGDGEYPYLRNTPMHDIVITPGVADLG